ncbi:MAG: KpsF/GutQ family sugar-phosphate isomerase [Opitutales bacterium]
MKNKENPPATPPRHYADLLEKGRQCLAIEAEALRATADALDERFAQVIGAMKTSLSKGRKIIFSGVGKSAHICQKLAGTFNSIGARSCFLDPTQALHGDLGLCTEDDLVVLLSNSGETEEMVRLLPLLKRFGLKTVAMTGHGDSTLAGACDHALLFRVPHEACPLNLAPTASTTASLALGDALAMVLLEVRGFTRKDFARFHPAGNLGMTLLLKVADIMRKGDRFPVLCETRPIREAIITMTRARAGCIALVDPEGDRLTGIFTDGDFRRSALHHPDCLEQPVAQFMTRDPRTVSAEALAVEAISLFEKHDIDDLIVVNEAGAPVGLIDNQDLPKIRIL